MEEDLTYTFPDFFGEGKDLIWDSDGNMFDKDLNVINPSPKLLSKLMFGTFDELANVKIFLNDLLENNLKENDPEGNVGPI
tara:strand:- start:1538 stop:1780 length:243 start_codon:yes stop_codon:yes gene_type:complete